MHSQEEHSHRAEVHSQVEHIRLEAHNLGEKDIQVLDIEQEVDMNSVEDTGPIENTDPKKRTDLEDIDQKVRNPVEVDLDTLEKKSVVATGS